MIGRELGAIRTASSWISAILLLLSPGCLMEVDVGTAPPPGDDDDDAPVLDRDRDGFTVAEGDCDDRDPEVGPAEAFSESCDGKDDDCSGEADVDVSGADVCATQDRFTEGLVLDLLLVVDRSPSAQPMLELASQAMPDLARHLVGPALDTHLGVVTMDMASSDQQGRLLDVSGRRWVSGSADSVREADSFLIRALTGAGTQSSGAEGGRAALEAALIDQADGWNAGFARSSAPLVVVFLSDDEDRSTSPTVDGLLDELASGRGTSGFNLHAVVQDTEEDCALEPSPETEGLSYMALAAQSSGWELSACEKDFGPFFSAVGQYAATRGLEDQFPLGARARAETVQVTLHLPDDGGTRRLAGDEFWLVDNNHTLLLQSPPPAGTDLVVDYDRMPGD